ncbi:Pkinase-domain-containing protein [Gonapodya prolifera JEL478]|uniref:Pkinase-domain-containing protein n=1 Tax=Gonapodya prolifera (strain JEL478) TaxID=1344416 RepID=A0A139AA76_GONPJ|nr:Pkinase-domain-containing protein [Gonapodya prolifera JEL478]|eukprot:KXS13405.1 Pkinase-domain-containing protein [Gonapodya prolifera JEL478]
MLNRQRDVDRSGARGATAKIGEERDPRTDGEAGRAAFRAQKGAAVGDSRKADRDGVPLDINHYNLGAVIGRGGFGVVREATVARGPAKGQKVAVKIIPASTLAHPPTAHRVRQEILVHRSLDHPNILRLLAHFRDSVHSPSTTPASRSNVPASSSQGGNVCLITELCPNSDLFSLLRDRGLIRTTASSPTPSKAESDRDNDRNLGMDEAEARWCAEDIVRGIAYLHGEGVIHRDLKLSNLLLDEDMHVKIGDFGLAARLDHPTAEQRTLCGTPNYISPEILSRRPYGLSSDAWSLGCLFATLLTGRPPFETSRVGSTLDKVARAEYEMPAWVSPEARDLVGLLLRKDPSSRPPVASLLEHPWFAAHLPRRSPHKGARVPSPASYGIRGQVSQPSNHPRKSDSSKPADSSAPSRMAPTNMRRIASAPSRAAAIAAVAATSSTGTTTDHDIPKSAAVPPATTRQRHGTVTAAQLGRAVYTVRSDIGSQTRTPTLAPKPTVELLPASRTSFVNPSPEPPLQPPVVPISTSSFSRSQSGRSLPSPIPVPRPDSPPSPPPLAATLQTTSALPPRSGPPPQTSFSTARLRPIRQRTRHCTVEIRKGGWVVVEVEGAREGGYVEMAVCVSPDWEEVAVLPSSLLRPAPPTDAPEISSDSCRPYDPLGRRVLIYRPPQEAPEEVGRWVRYAGRFVALVRGKTAKVVLYSPHAKCVLYENDPPDFSAQLHHPARHNRIAKVHVSTSAKTVAVYSADTSMPPESFEVDLLAQSLPAVIPSHLSSLLRHTRECLRTCRDVAASAGAEARWPVVIKSSRCTPSAVSTGSGAAADRSGRQSLGGVSAGVTEEGSRHGELEMGVRTRRLEGDRDSERTLGDTGSARSVIGQFGGSAGSYTGDLRDDKGKAKLQPVIAPAADPPVAPSRVSHASSVPPLTHRPLHLTGVGWCLRTGDGKYLMLFDDGTTLRLDAGTQSVTWRDVDGGCDEERYEISKKMPAEVKDKLKYFVQFVQTDS